LSANGSGGACCENTTRENKSLKTSKSIPVIKISFV
jgi:hypothetical protein